MLLLDGLYTKDFVFNTCKKNSWACVITFKDNSLKSVQEQISDMNIFNDFLTQQNIDATNTHWLKSNYKIFQNVEYKEQTLHVCENSFSKEHKEKKETEKTKFVYITDLKIDTNNVHQICNAGRLRWKIENEGFNNQKNTDYNLSHKFSRTNFNATKNYYQLLQIADIINQFTYKLKEIKEFITDKGLTINALINIILGLLNSFEFEDDALIKDILSNSKQLRY